MHACVHVYVHACVLCHGACFSQAALKMKLEQEYLVRVSNTRELARGRRPHPRMTDRDRKRKAVTCERELDQLHVCISAKVKPAAVIQDFENSLTPAKSPSKALKSDSRLGTNHLVKQQLGMSSLLLLTSY